MIYRKFKDLDISMLGFGLMRLPVKEDGRIDEELTAEMVDYAMKHGVNYYDTAWPYHSGIRERHRQDPEELSQRQLLSGGQVPGTRSLREIRPGRYL